MAGYFLICTFVLDYGVTWARIEGFRFSFLIWSIILEGPWWGIDLVFELLAGCFFRPGDGSLPNNRIKIDFPLLLPENHLKNFLLGMYIILILDLLFSDLAFGWDWELVGTMGCLLEAGRFDSVWVFLPANEGTCWLWLFLNMQVVEAGEYIRYWFCLWRTASRWYMSEENGVLL